MAFWGANMIFVFFVSGLSFFVMGLAIAVEAVMVRRHRLIGHLWLLAAFGLLHGLSEWATMFGQMQAQYVGPMSLGLSEVAKLTLMALSFACLLQFGLELLPPPLSAPRWPRALPPILFLLWGLSSLAPAIMGADLGGESLIRSEVWARYSLGLPASLLTAYVLLSRARLLSRTGKQQAARGLMRAGVAFVFYGLLAGLVVPQAPFFPASFLNSETLSARVGFPVQVLRTLCALAIAWSLSRTFIFEHWRTLRRINTRLASLNESLQVITSSLELGTILHLILEQLEQVVDYDASAILLLTDGVLKVTAARGFPDKEQVVQLSFGLEENAHLRRLVQERRPLIFSDGRRACPFEGQAGLKGIRTYLGVPLRAKNRLIGLLIVLSARAHCYDQEDAQIIFAFANQAAIAMENARLFSQVKGFSRQLEHKVKERTTELMAAQRELAQKAHQLQRLLAGTIQVQEEERARIAHDMHDGVIQLVIGALYETQAARESLPASPEVALERLKTAQELLKKVETETRRVIYDLRPLILDSMGLVPALKRYATSYEELFGLPCSVRVSGTSFRLPTDVELAIYRMVQEALQNVESHAQATRVEVLINFRPSHVKVVVQDDGRGFNYEEVLRQANEHLGLIGMKERAQSIGGQIEVESSPGQGARIILTVPVNEKR
ncbi:MAG: GAF domain-containing protein [Anaerolineae bacterium]